MCIYSAGNSHVVPLSLPTLSVTLPSTDNTSFRRSPDRFADARHIVVLRKSNFTLDFHASDVSDGFRVSLLGKWTRAVHGIVRFTSYPEFLY